MTIGCILATVLLEFVFDGVSFFTHFVGFTCCGDYQSGLRRRSSSLRFWIQGDLTM
jgi:hypothetical protein